MLRGQALLRRVEVGRLALGVLKRFERAHRLVLVDVSGGILKRLDEEAREDGGVLFGAALGGGNHRAALALQRRHPAAARARRVHDELTRRLDGVAQAGQVGGRDVGTDEVELVLDAVVRTMADQDQHEVVLRLRGLRHLAHHIVQPVARRGVAGQRVDVNGRTRRLQQLVELVDRRGKALLIVDVASQAADGHVVHVRARKRRP